ncbi:MAG: hypothetical protein QOJ78_472 [Pseudonocardiales bacterium]|jgi:hypothetical protein|nr:hypothetical protein [Pseudonocardiales bacterium]MDT4930914.1 hypothetical protein [Pseudonocardiales bacterium]MDT4949033.1 hypothetical protein [Pseudonocardiales bacterium]
MTEVPDSERFETPLEDALEQRTEVAPEPEDDDLGLPPAPNDNANEADLLEQNQVVPDDDDDDR